MAQHDNFMLIGLPYAAFVLMIIGTIYRYRANKFSFSSLSSQFLEGRTLFWGSMPFHWGLVVVFLGHLTAFLVPSGIIAFNRQPVRLIILETTGVIFGLMVLFGLVALFVRRTTNQRLGAVTTRMDIVVEVLLIVQVVIGISIAVALRWGSSWFAEVLSPYLWSLVVFRPDIAATASLHWLIKLHIILAYVILALVPFSRLVHILVVPFSYMWRPYQRVMWSWDRKRIRRPDSKWSITRPRNN